MFNFLENAELLKEKNRQRKIEYRKDLLLQIEQNKLKRLEEKNKLKNGINKKCNLLNEKNIFNNKSSIKIPLDRKKRFLNKIQSLKISLDNSLNKKSLNKKQFSLTNITKNNTNINKRFNNLYISTDFLSNKNSIKSKINNLKITSTESKVPIGHIMKKSFSQMLKSISIPYNYNNKTLMKEIDIQFLFKEFVDEQIKTINDYATNLENIFCWQYMKKNSNISLFNELIKSEKKKAMQNIQNEQNKLKNKFGFFPMETFYNYRIEQLFNKILNKIISIYSSISQVHINNYINQDNSYFNIISNNSKFNENSVSFGENKFSSKFNIKDELTFLDTWKTKFKNEIKDNKNKKLELNKQIESKNNINIFPANNFFKNAERRYFNINKQNINNEIILPDIYLQENNFKKRYKSANNKNSEISLFKSIKNEA